jgi:hypothetical protein
MQDHISNLFEVEKYKTEESSKQLNDQKLSQGQLDMLNKYMSDPNVKDDIKKDIKKLLDQ